MYHFLPAKLAKMIHQRKKYHAAADEHAHTRKSYVKCLCHIGLKTQGAQRLGFVAKRALFMIIRKTRTAVRLGRQALQYWQKPLVPAQAGAALRVLFVTEANGATLRYRVLNQIEELQIANIQCAALHPSYHGIRASAHDCDVLVLYRLHPRTRIEHILEVARSNGARIVFDTDDLVWDQRIVEYCQLEQHHSADEIAQLGQGFERTASLMQQVDAFVASTPFLAELIRTDFSQPVFVNMNALSQAIIAQSQLLYAQRQQRAASEQLIIGYFSGWPRTHEQDLALALPGIQQALDQLPQARLRIVGHFDQAQLPIAMQARVDVAPFVAYDHLLAAISEVDINLAPIVNNPHRRAKSAVKFLEAALIAVPTIASNLEPYHIIQQAKTGYLASTTEEWASHLLTLAQNPALRDTIGQAARAQVLSEHSTAVRAVEFVHLLKQVTLGTNDKVTS